MNRERHALAKKLFLGACDRPPEERAAYLERACRGDPALREEVEALLACDEADETAPLLQSRSPGRIAKAAGTGSGGAVGWETGPSGPVVRLQSP